MGRHRVSGLVWVALVGCGRLGFPDGDGSADGDATGADAAGVDAAPLTLADLAWAGPGDGAPGPLFAPRLAFDPRRGVVVMYGGSRLTSSAGAVAAMWELRDGAWGLLCDPCPPGPRLGHALGTDPSTGNVVLFGGELAGTEQGDTWEWDGATWSEQVLAGTAPGPRRDSQLVVEPGGGLLLVGGHDGSSNQASAFRYQDRTWQPHPGNAGAPAPVSCEGQIAAAAATRVVASLNARESGLFDELWGLEGATWGRICTDCAGMLRRDVTVGFHQAAQALVVIGGYTGSTELAGTSVLDQDRLVPWSPDPPARDTAGVAYDPVRRTLVLYGGNGNSCPAQGQCDQTWQLGPR